MARRPPGEGSIYQRGSDGRWVGALTIASADGTQKRKTVTGKTRKIVATKLAELRAEATAGVTIDDTTTVAEWVRYWVEVVSDNRATSARSDHDRAEQWIYHNLIGRYPLRGLREEHVRVWHRQMLDYRGPRSPEGLAPRTIHRVHTVLQAALTAAVKDRRVVRNVAANVTPPKVGPKPPHHDQLTADEGRQLIKGNPDYRTAARIVVALVGIEQSAALGLRWEECPPGVLSVRRTIHRIKGQGLVAEDEAKAARRIRDVSVGPAFTTIIEAWRIESGGHGWMFPGYNPANPQDPRRDYESWRLALTRAGVRHVPLHGARGAGASAMKGAPVRVAADVLGHAQTRMTTDVYQRSSEAERLAATTAIERALGFSGEDD